jgi:hypothetical protein
MPIKKILKIAGLAVLAIVILWLGLVIVLSSLGKTVPPIAYRTGSYDLAAEEAGGAGAVGLTQAALPMAKSSNMLVREVASDSAPSAMLVAVDNSTAVEKKIIKTGDLNLKVEKTDTAAESITNIAKANKGEVVSSNFYQSSRGVKSGYITVRVPFNKFEVVFKEIKKVARQVMSESANAQDITEQYIDLEARLKNARAEEASFVALLSRWGKVEDVLAVTREVARVRGEIEQLQGQMRYLNSQTDMSTITVNLSEDVEIAPVSQDWRPWQVVKTSVKHLIVNGQNFIDSLIAFLIVVLPALIIYVLVIWLIYYLGKKVYQRFVKKQE